MTQILSQIKALYLCRDQQLNQLYEYLCHNWSTILVYGSRGTAKTSCVNALVNKLNLFHAFVNCLEVFNNKMIFESILSQLNDRNEGIDRFLENTNSLSDFIHYLKLILRQFVINYNKNQNNRKQFNKCVIVFDSFEHLFVDKNNDLIQWLTNLEELTENICPISCIFISRHSLDWFCRLTDHSLNAIQINFTNYSTEEMSQILLNDCPLNYTKHFYQKLFSFYYFCYCLFISLQIY
jgi:Cdc6-like AAA superfamily ATPase